jgi:formylglycine-generating enzyme required for sulfatase activity
VDCSYVNYNEGAYCVDPPLGAANRVGSESPTGDARWGHSDLAGNVWEWTLDLNDAYVVPCDDCADLTTGTDRVARGGSWDHDHTYLRTSSRGSLGPPTSRSLDVGVRCARP